MTYTAIVNVSLRVAHWLNILKIGKIFIQFSFALFGLLNTSQLTISINNFIKVELNRENTKEIIKELSNSEVKTSMMSINLKYKLEALDLRFLVEQTYLYYCWFINSVKLTTIVYMVSLAISILQRIVTEFSLWVGLQQNCFIFISLVRNIIKL